MDNYNKKKGNIILFIGYVIMALPMCFSMYYSVPLGDDFAFGANTVSNNIVVNAAGYSAWNWMNWSGRWLTFFFQKLTCPLNLHIHLGHVYGLIMIVLFIIFTTILVYSIYNILLFVLDKNEHLSRKVTFIVVAVLYTTNYYSEVFNWYIGATAYALPMVLMLLTFVYILKYNEYGDKMYYRGLIIAGIYPAANEMFDVPLGVFYLYALIRKCKKKNEKVLTMNNIIPLCIYVVLGMSNVFAPGNRARQEYYQANSSLVKGLVYTILDILVRLQDVIVDHPLTVFLFMLLIVAGAFSNKEFKKEEGFIALAITMAIAVFGCLFPYVYARAFTSTYIDVRMEYVVEYLTLMSISILCLKVGRWLAYKYELNYSATSKLAIYSVIIMFAYVSLIQSYAYIKLTQIDIIRNRGLIKESYELWDGILLEIENSAEDDVVIHRENELNWSPYFLYTGLTNGDVFSVSADTIYDKEWIMPNVYYGKNSIQLVYDNPIENN